MERLYTAKCTAAPTAIAWTSIGATAKTLGIGCIQEVTGRLGDNRMRVVQLWKPHWIGSVFAVAGVLLTSYVAQVHGREAAYSIRDTAHRFAGLPSTIQQIFWLDDDRILYTGYEPSVREVRKEDGKSVTKRGIYVLDVRSNKVTRHADAEGFLCYRNGFVRYSVTFDPKSRIAVRREGRFGEEKEIVVDMKEQPTGHLVNPLTCDDYDARGNATERGKRLPLLNDHGVLEYARVGPIAGSPMFPARLYRFGGKEPITLGVDGAAVSEARVRYYEFADVYTVGYLPPPGLSTQWPKNAVHYIYLMNPKGDVTEVPISGGAWSDVPVHRFVLSKAGIVLYGGKLRKYLDPGTTGVYLVQGVRTLKLVSGLLSGIGVSPSGCSVAVAMTSYSKSPDPTTIRIIEFCGKEGIK
jgi:hypothetical protein